MPSPSSPANDRPTRERILDAAEDVFAQVGYEAASLGAIADQVGIRTPSLYKHFPSKHEIYTGVLERLLEPHIEAMQALLTRPDTPAQAIQNMAAVMELYFARPNLARLVQHAALAQGEELETILSRWYRPLLKRAAELTPEATLGGATIDPMQLVTAMHAMLSGLVTLAPLHQGAGAPPNDALMSVLAAWVQALWQKTPD